MVPWTRVVVGQYKFLPFVEIGQARAGLVRV